MGRVNVNQAARLRRCANQMRAGVRRGQDASVEPLDLATAIGALTTADRTPPGAADRYPLFG